MLGFPNRPIEERDGPRKLERLGQEGAWSLPGEVRRSGDGAARARSPQRPFWNMWELEVTPDGKLSDKPHHSLSSALHALE